MSRSSNHPPRWADRFLEWYCRPDILEELQGDLYELFEHRLASKGTGRAKWAFVWDVLRSFRPSNIRLPKINPYPIMIRNYIIVALRTLTRNRQYTVINILGLAIGLACFLLIALHLEDELSYDRHHPNPDRLYRIAGNWSTDHGGIGEAAFTFSPLRQQLLDHVPEVENVVRLYDFTGDLQGQFCRSDNMEDFINEGFVFADSAFFDLFGYRTLYGNARDALDEPFEMALTQGMAERFFGRTDVVGETLAFREDEGKYEFVIKAVLENPQHLSHFRFDLFASFTSLEQIMPWYDNWYHPEMYIYATAREGVARADFQDKINELHNKIPRPDVSQERTFEAQPVTDIHLHSHREGEIEPTSDIAYIYVFAIIAFFILFIACINFMNLATSSATSRAKEVGVRKTLGARRSQLIQQFLGESLVMTFLAFVLAIGLVSLALPYFNQLLDKDLTIDLFHSWPVPISLLGLLVVVSLLAGLYPAFFLSSIRTVKVLKGINEKMWRGTVGIRRGLVIFQFVISCALIISTGIMNKQLHYLQNKNLGFRKDQIITIPLREQEDQINHEAFKERLLTHPEVLSVAASSGVPTTEGLYGFQIEPKNAAFDSLNFLTFTVDHDFAETYELKFIAGRDFSKDYSTDATSAFVLNESAVEKLGWENPIGQELTLTYYLERALEKTGQVIGVVEDFHYYSLHREVEPLIMHILPNTYYNNYLSVKISSDNVPAALSAIEREWKGFNPSRPFEYQFLDETFANLYDSERRLSRLFFLFSLLAVFIACLGLFALAALTCEQRTKEIGIRKVFGATVPDIVWLLSNQFARLVLVAFLLSVPLAWFATDLWLEDFAYQTQLGPGIFLLAGGIALVIALATTSYHTLKVAVRNPVRALRYE
jgi:putative ABC transport system permease protein